MTDTAARLNKAVRILNFDQAQVQKEEELTYQGGKLNSRKVAVVAILGASSVLAATAAIVATVFAAYLVTVVCAAAAAVFLLSGIVAYRIDLSKDLLELIDKLSERVDQTIKGITSAEKKENTKDNKDVTNKELKGQNDTEELKKNQEFERLKKDLEEKVKEVKILNEKLKQQELKVKQETEEKHDLKEDAKQDTDARTEQKEDRAPDELGNNDPADLLANFEEHEKQALKKETGSKDNDLEEKNDPQENETKQGLEKAVDDIQRLEQEESPGEVELPKKLEIHEAEVKEDPNNAKDLSAKPQEKEDANDINAKLKEKKNELKDDKVLDQKKDDHIETSKNTEEQKTVGEVNFQEKNIEKQKQDNVTLNKQVFIQGLQVYQNALKEIKKILPPAAQNKFKTQIENLNIQKATFYNGQLKQSDTLLPKINEDIIDPLKQLEKQKEEIEFNIIEETNKAKKEAYEDIKKLATTSYKPKQSKAKQDFTKALKAVESKYIVQIQEAKE